MHPHIQRLTALGPDVMAAAAAAPPSPLPVRAGVMKSRQQKLAASGSWKEVLMQSMQGKKTLHAWQLGHLSGYFVSAGISAANASAVCTALNAELKVCSLEHIRDADEATVVEACRQLAIYGHDASTIHTVKLAVADIGAINGALDGLPTERVAYQHARITVQGAGVAEVNGYYAIETVDPTTNQVVYSKIQKNGVAAITTIAEETGRVLLRFCRDGRDPEGRPARSGNWILMLSAKHDTYLYWQLGNGQTGYRLCTPDVVGTEPAAQRSLQWRIGRLPGVGGYTTFNVPGSSLSDVPIVEDFYPWQLE